MKGLYHTSAILFIYFLLSSQCSGQNIIPHPVPEEFVSLQYSVTVNDQPVQVFHAGLNVCFVSFDFTGEAKIEVSVNNFRRAAWQSQLTVSATVNADKFWQGDAIVRPLSNGVKAVTNGKTATFTLSDPGQYSLEPSGTTGFLDDVIFIFANKPEENRPSADTEGVIYLKPGIHQQNIDLQSGQTLYLEDGAVLYGALNIWDAKNVTIAGRGVILYSGPQSEDKDTGYKHRKNWRPLTTHNLDGLNVDGITIINRSRTWTIQMHTTFNAVFNNIKLLSINPQNTNGDGFDWFGGGKTRIANSLVRCADDCFAFFTPDSGTDLYLPGISNKGEVKNIMIEHCVLWPSLANVFRLGFNGQDLITDNVTMKNCDVIHIGKGEWMQTPWAIFCALSTDNRGKAIHSNYLLENIRVEEPTAFLGLQIEEAGFKNFIFRNITIAGEKVPSYVRSKVDGLTFENVTVNGKPLAGKEDLLLKSSTGEIKNLKFLK